MVKPAAAPAPTVSLRTRALEEALRIADAEGLDALSIRRLADALGVKGASLYHHFKDKDEILDGVATIALSELRPPSDESLGWIDWLLQVARSYREALLAHPNLLPLVLGRHNRRAGSAVYDYAAMKLTAAGIPPAYQLTLINALESYATGAVLYGLSAPAAAWEASLPADGCEHLRLALRSDALDEDARFELGCRALLEGLAAQLARPG
ncbi:MAG TPA: TetR/AcrR family transcriptional regulator C-terminal domain-containing protein [Acidimicrobiia bacterium]|nr:TetR/AcrR family transcriptional regulator C-terminal domain-containing protein [Acidimicrobiia bacterium]HTC81857.1 TetR/AcrR family transcriptional regulator C-terminal domain-containing protein [Acidimicrobiia bacterium]